MKRKLICTALAALALTSASANAALFTFDPTGTAGVAGDIQNIALIDQAPGNALAIGGVTAIQNFLSGQGPTGFTLTYQANLSNLQFADTSIAFSNGGGGDFFTFAAAFGERVISASGVPGNAAFAFDAANPNNYFKMYAGGAIADNLTGAGFVTPTVILEGRVTSVTSSSFTLTNPNGGNLDQSPNGNQFPGQLTVAGSGASDISIEITAVDNNYFPTLDLLNTIVFSFFNTSQVDPFRQIDPSRCFTNLTGTANCVVNPVLGAVNGINGPDFQFQADANQSLLIPEPGSLALIGLGLFALGGLRRRASQQ
jgi:hypothetical protein